MPNYNYRSNDYVRRTQCNRPMPAPPFHPDSSYSPCVNEHPAETCPLDLLNGLSIAMAYVPCQKWRKLYSLEKSFHKGTIFEELDKPFSGTGGCCK